MAHEVKGWDQEALEAEEEGGEGEGEVEADSEADSEAEEESPFLTVPE